MCTNICLNPEQRRRLIKLLQAEEKTIDANAETAMLLQQPLGGLIFSGGYSCDVLPDGSEVFEGDGIKVTIPPSCVEWDPDYKKMLEEKMGPTEMDKVRRAVFFKLLKEAAEDKKNKKGNKKDKDVNKDEEKEDEALLEKLIQEFKAGLTC